MAQVIKTGISLEKSLLKQIDALAHELEISRSRLFVLAVEEFIHRRENQKLLESINAAYDDLPDSEEENLRNTWRRYHRELVEAEW
jgi:metal-responsive CopG/Arc/MetJ family transcriptional regulator